MRKEIFLLAALALPLSGNLALPEGLSTAQGRLPPGRFSARWEGEWLLITALGKSWRLYFGKSPPAEGKVTIRAQESRQPFDVLAGLRTSISGSEETSTQEVCPDNENGPDAILERHYVRYFFRESRRQLAASLTKPGLPGEVLGTFRGSRTDAEKEYTYQEVCP